MYPDTPRYGPQSIKSDVNSAGMPTVQSMQAIKIPGYLDNLLIKNVLTKTIYVMFFDSVTVPTSITTISNSNYIAPKLTLKIDPAPSTSVQKVVSFDVNYLKQGKYYADGDDYFTKGISIGFSTNPNFFSANPGSYPIILTGQVSLGKMTKFNSKTHGINIGQESHPAIIENGVTVVPAGQFDIRPGGAWDSLCAQTYADGWRDVRMNYLAPIYANFANWQSAILIAKKYFPNLRVGITSTNGGSVPKAQFDAFIDYLPTWVNWCVKNGITRIALANEEANHTNTASYTSAGVSDYQTYIAQRIFDASVIAKKMAPPTTEFSFSFSRGEIAKIATLLSTGYANSIDAFCLNIYDTVMNAANILSDTVPKFVVAGKSKLQITECGKDRGIYDPIFGGSQSGPRQGNEQLQAVDYAIRRNICDALDLPVQFFCRIDGGVGGPKDQFGLVKMDGHRRIAYSYLVGRYNYLLNDNTKSSWLGNLDYYNPYFYNRADVTYNTIYPVYNGVLPQLLNPKSKDSFVEELAPKDSWSAVDFSPPSSFVDMLQNHNIYTSPTRNSSSWV